MSELQDSVDETASPRVLIVSEHASARFGGEGCLPWHYFRLLRRRGVEAWLIVHERTKEELLTLLPMDAERMHFVPDTRFDKIAWKLSRFLPDQISYLTLGYASRIRTQLAVRKLARRLIREKGIQIVHQPIPVSPREPSLIHSMGAPVIIGPMNGNMSYPPGMTRGHGKLKAIGAFVGLGRHVSNLLHRLMAGKIRAAALLVANERTRQALPSGRRGDVITLAENGVDLDIWFPSVERPQVAGPVRFIFIGRLVDWKAIDLLLIAFSHIQIDCLPMLEIVGDGPERPGLEALATTLGIKDRVHFAGWQNPAECAVRLRAADALVLPSLYECGGAVVLEAMACGKPVIATAWGGPTDYLDASCGILVPPDSRESLIAGLTAAMARLAADTELRTNLGPAGRQRVEKQYDWERKIDCIISIYHHVIRDHREKVQ